MRWRDMDEKPGPTGDYPNGKLNEQDEGGLNIQVGTDAGRRVVLMDFGVPTPWIGMTPKDAMKVADMLREQAGELLRERSRREGRQLPHGDTCPHCGHDHFVFKSVKPGDPRWVCVKCDVPLP